MPVFLAQQCLGTNSNPPWHAGQFPSASLNSVSPPGTLSCEAGCSLKKLEKKARKKRLFFPVDLAIREAQIGGVVAADMAGARTARYGNLHGNVLGLEVVSG